MADITPMHKEYGEMIYALLTEMNGALMAQSRAMNNNLSNNQRTMLELQVSINNMIMGLKETRVKRHQEEIDTLELQMHVLTQQLGEKRISKNQPVSTSEKILSVLEQREQMELKRKQIDWIDVRNKVLIVAITAAVLYLLPVIGKLMQAIFSTP